VTEEEHVLLLSFDHELSDDEIEELRVSSNAIGIWRGPGILDATLRVTGPFRD
jgi:hypothetical protein